MIQVKTKGLKDIRIGRKEGKFTHVNTTKKGKNKKYFRAEHERLFLNLIRALQVGDHVEINSLFPLVEKQLRWMVRKIVNRLNLTSLVSYYDNGEWEHDIVSYVFSKLDNYSPEKGKVFSYISVIIVNYAINLNNKIYYKRVGYHSDFYADNPNTEDYKGLDEKEELSYEIDDQINLQVDFENFCNLFLNASEETLLKHFQEDEVFIVKNIALSLKYDPDIITTPFLGVVHRMICEFCGVEFSRYKFSKVFKKMVQLYHEVFNRG